MDKSKENNRQHFVGENEDPEIWSLDGGRVIYLASFWERGGGITEAEMMGKEDKAFLRCGTSSSSRLNRRLPLPLEDEGTNTSIHVLHERFSNTQLEDL